MAQSHENGNIALMETIRVRRVYEPAAPEDGTRVLVDRLWPRGLTKDAVAADLWMKDIGPSTAPRTWFGHDPDRCEDFRRRHRAELAADAPLLDQLTALTANGTLTLLFGAKDEARNQAVVIAEVPRTR